MYFTLLNGHLKIKCNRTNNIAKSNRSIRLLLQMFWDFSFYTASCLHSLKTNRLFMLLHTRWAFRPRRVCECLFTLLWGVLSCLVDFSYISLASSSPNARLWGLWSRIGCACPFFTEIHALCSSFLFLAHVLNADSDSLAALQEINEDYWFLSSTHHWLVITCYHSITCLQYCQILFLYVCQNKWRAWCW